MAKEVTEGSWENRASPRRSRGKGTFSGYQKAHVGTSDVFTPGQVLETLAENFKKSGFLGPPPTWFIKAG